MWTVLSYFSSEFFISSRQLAIAGKTVAKTGRGVKKCIIMSEMVQEYYNSRNPLGILNFTEVPEKCLHLTSYPLLDCQGYTTSYQQLRQPF